MIDYANIYYEQITKLYEDYLNSFKYKKEKHEYITRMETLLKEIYEEDNNQYEQKLKELSFRPFSSVLEKLNILKSIEKLVKERLDTINDYVTAFENETKSLINDDFNISKLTTKLDSLESEIEVLNTYIENQKQIETMTKVNEDADIKLNKIKDKKTHTISVNSHLEEELNEVITEILKTNQVEEINEEDVIVHYPQYQELYLKAKEQESEDENIKSILSMADTNYTNYSIQKALLALRPLKEEKYQEYQELNEKREKILTIINEGRQKDTFAKLKSIIETQKEALDIQLKDIKVEELLETVKKNNQEKISKLQEENDLIEKNIHFDNSELEKEPPKEEIPLQEQSTEEKPNFKLVEVEPIEIIKNPFVEKKEIKEEKGKQIITQKQEPPTWIEYAIVENEHKFINWFDKLNALIKRKKYLKDE